MVDLDELHLMLGHVRTETAALLAALDALTDDDCAGESLLPEWTRGHVLSHLARNADSQVHLLEGALVDEVRDQYPGGDEGRAAAIEAGAERDADELVTDLVGACARLDEVYGRMTAAAWGRMTRPRRGPHPASDNVWSRWREVAIHRIDLDLRGDTLDAAWGDAFVARMLPEAAADLDTRLPPGVQVVCELVEPDTTIRAGAPTPGALLLEISGSSRAAVAWMLGRGVAPAAGSRLEVLDDGFVGALPPLGEWG